MGRFFAILSVVKLPFLRTLYLKLKDKPSSSLYPEPQSRFFFPRYFRNISTIKFHAAYTTIKLFCTQIQDVSTHTRFTTLKSKEICRYLLHDLPRLRHRKSRRKQDFDGQIHNCYVTSYKRRLLHYCKLLEKT